MIALALCFMGGGNGALLALGGGYTVTGVLSLLFVVAFWRLVLLGVTPKAVYRSDTNGQAPKLIIWARLALMLLLSLAKSLAVVITPNDHSADVIAIAESMK